MARPRRFQERYLVVEERGDNGELLGAEGPFATEQRAVDIAENSARRDLMLDIYAKHVYRVVPVSASGNGRNGPYGRRSPRIRASSKPKGRPVHFGPPYASTQEQDEAMRGYPDEATFFGDI